MLFRKIQAFITDHLRSASSKVLIVDGARQIGKTYIIRHVCQEMFANYVEINLLEDSIGDKLFERTTTVEDFYLRLSMVAGNKLGDRSDTIVFLDEIQAYPHLLTLLKFLKRDDRYHYVASGSLLGVTLSKTTSIPMGSIEVKHMYPLDFEEFLLANGFGKEAIDVLRRNFKALESPDEAIHAKVMDLFRKYLLVGGLPDAVNTYLSSKNIVKVRTVQNEIHEYYAMDAAKYDKENRLKIFRNSGKFFITSFVLGSLKEGLKSR